MLKEIKHRHENNFSIHMRKIEKNTHFIILQYMMMKNS